MALKAIARLILPKGKRHACFRCVELRPGDRFPAATHRAPDPDRADRLSYWCADHAPNDAPPIVDADPFLAVGLGLVVVLPGTTSYGPEAIAAARATVQAAVLALGGRCEVLGAEAGLLAPSSLVVADGAPGRREGPTRNGN